MVYNAGIVLVIILHVPLLRNHLPEDRLLSLDAALSTSLELLDEYCRRGVSLATKCVETLQQAHTIGAASRGPEPLLADADLLHAGHQNEAETQSSDHTRGNFTGLEWLNGLSDLSCFDDGIGLGDDAPLFDFE